MDNPMSGDAGVESLRKYLAENRSLTLSEVAELVDALNKCPVQSARFNLSDEDHPVKEPRFSAEIPNELKIEEAPGGTWDGWVKLGEGALRVKSASSEPSTPGGGNPKDALGSAKLPLHLWPATATAVGCLGLLEGHEKYGRSNFRATDVRASVYVAACKRHLDDWFEGAETASDSPVPNLGSALACLAILVDAQTAGSLMDDRQYPGHYRGLVEALTPLVKQVQEQHADKNPKHYTIADTPK